MSDKPPMSGGPSPALVFDTLFAHQRTAALRAAIELDLFRAIGERPGDVASFSLTMLASTAKGDAYTLRELEAMYREAGFSNVSGKPVPTGPHTVVIGHVA